THEARAGGQRKEAVAETDEAPRRDHVLETDPALGVVADLDHLAAPLAQCLGDRAEMLLANIDGEPLDGLHPLTVDGLDDGLGSGDLELIALPPHRLDEHCQVQLSAAADEEALSRVGLHDVQPEVDVELLEQARAQLARGGELALA